MEKAAKERYGLGKAWQIIGGKWVEIVTKARVEIKTRVPYKE